MTDYLKVFLSSTHADLADVRGNIIKFISILKSDVLAMEVFGSDESQPIDFCLSKVKACNIFVGIYAERYGSIDSKSGKSITELEYLEANRMLKAGHLKGLLLYLIDPQAEWPLNFVERDPKKVNRLENFKQRIKNDHTVSFFRSTEELPLLVLRDVIRKVGIGSGEPFRSKSARNVKQKSSLNRPVGMEYYGEDLGKIFFGRDTEQDALLERALTHKISLLIGASGVGKTSLLHAGLTNLVKTMGWRTALVRPLTEPIQNLKRFLWDQLFEGDLPPELDLSSILRAAALANKNNHVLVVIDQFEDVLSAKNPDEMEALTKHLFNIYSTAEDNLSIIISYRGDVEPNIGSIWQKISGSPQGLPRTYLGPLQKNNAKHVIAGNLEALHINLKDAGGNEQLLLDILVDDLESESLMNGYSGVYPPFIQMVIARIFQDKENNSYRSQKYYEAGQSRKIISDYLMNQLKYLGKNIDSGKKVLVALVSSYGTKAQKTLEEIATEALLPRSGIEMILNSLIDLRLVRNIEGTYEISHDFLARTITSELVSVDKRETKKYKELIASRTAAYSSTKAGLTKAEHMYIYKFRNMILLTDQEIKLLLLSYLSGNGPISYWAKRVPIPKLKSWANEFASNETNEVKQAVCNFLIRIGEPPQLSVLADAFSDYKQQYQLFHYISDFGTIEDIGLLMTLNRKRAEDVVNASRDVLVRLIEPKHQAILREIMPVMASSKRLQAVKTFEAIAIKIGETSALNNIRDGLCSKELWQQLLSVHALSAKGQREDLSELRHMMQRKMPNKLRTAVRKTIVRLELRFGELKELNMYIYSSDKSTVKEALDAINIPSELLTLDMLMNLYNDHPNEVAGVIYRTSQASDLPKLKKILSNIPLEQPAREIVYAVCRLGCADEFSFLFRLFLDYKDEIRFWNPFSVVSRISDLASPHHLPLLKKIVEADDFWTYYKEKDRPKDKMPVENYSNAYFIKRLAGTAFGKVAKRKEFPLVYEMLEHNYWIIRNAAMNAIKKYGTVNDLEKLVQMAIDSGASKEGFIEAICTIDDKINPI